MAYKIHVAKKKNKKIQVASTENYLAISALAVKQYGAGQATVQPKGIGM